MVGFGFFMIAVSMWRFTHFSLAATYKDFVLARMLQGLGLAFVFVPTAAIAYSYLPPNKNNKASSMTNLFRNQGGSFGIAFATTMFARRLQFHQNVLGANLTAGRPEYRTFMRGLTDTLTHAGLSPAAAVIRARAMLGQTLGQQVSVLAYLDCFWLLGLIALAGFVLAFGVKKFKPARGPGGGGH